MRYSSKMTFRTVVQDGLIVVNTHGALPDGTAVDVVPARRARPRKGESRKPSAGSKSPKKKRLRDLAFFGMWKDRPEWKGKSTLEIAAELREKALGRRTRRSNG